MSWPFPIPCTAVVIGREFRSKVKAKKKGRVGARCKVKICCSFVVILLWFNLQYIRLIFLKSSLFYCGGNWWVMSPSPHLNTWPFSCVFSPAGLGSDLVSRQGQPTTANHVACGKDLPGPELWVSATKAGRCGLHFWVVGALEQRGFYLPGGGQCVELLEAAQSCACNNPQKAFDLCVDRSDHSKSRSS